MQIHPKLEKYVARLNEIFESHPHDIENFGIQLVDGKVAGMCWRCVIEKRGIRESRLDEA